MNLPYLTALAVVVPLAGWAEVTVSDPWAGASTLESRPAAAYLTVVSDSDDRLIEARTSVAREITVQMTEADDAAMNRMKHVTRVDFPAGEAVTFAPGGMHLMLTGLSGNLVEGTTFRLTLRFEAAGEVTVEVPVLGVAASGPEVSGK